MYLILLTNLLISCVSIYGSYHLFFKILSYNKQFNTLKEDRQYYVVKNIIKSINLLGISLCTFETMHKAMINQPIDNFFIKTIATIYVTNDIVALAVVPNLPKSTKIHHSTTTLLLFFNYISDYSTIYEPSNVEKLIIVYALFSCYSFSVNFYLGVRLLNDESTKFESFIKNIRYSSFVIYLLSCSLNWSYQIFTLLSNPIGISQIIYVMVMSLVVYDDLVLLSWLK
jgi:hypothetical protein